MASIWSIVAYWVLPIPLTLFALLSLPLPRNIRRGILLFTQRVFDLPLVGVLKLLHVMLWATAMAFLGSVRQAHLMREAQKDTVWAAPNMEINYLSKRWRAERNMWMTAFAFTAWVFLAAFYREAVRRLDLEARLSDMERSDYTATETREREPSVGREVTSKAAAAAASRERTPVGSPNKTFAAAPASADVVGSVPGGSSAATGGIQMQALKKAM